jgi:hypothetical protein
VRAPLIFSFLFMKTRIGSIIGWICAILVAFLTISSAIAEFIPVTDPATLAFIQKLGVGDITIQLGIAKLILAALYLIPRTSTVGFVLMVGYYGGALATNITHGFAVPDYAPILLAFVFMTIGAYFRNPELLTRLKGEKIAA